MTREELLDFLKNKRSATAGVASAQQALAADQDKLAKDKKRFHKTIIGFGILAVAALLLQSGASLVITSAAIAIGLFVFKYLHYLSPTNTGMRYGFGS